MWSSVCEGESISHSKAGFNPDRARGQMERDRGSFDQPTVVNEFQACFYPTIFGKHQSPADAERQIRPFTQSLANLLIKNFKYRLDGIGLTI